jgi:hypothetical protein
LGQAISAANINKVHILHDNPNILIVLPTTLRSLGQAGQEVFELFSGCLIAAYTGHVDSSPRDPAGFLAAPSGRECLSEISVSDEQSRINFQRSLKVRDGVFWSARLGQRHR